MKIFLKKSLLVSLFLLAILFVVREFAIFQEGIYFNLIGLAFLFVVSIFVFLLMAKGINSDKNQDFMIYTFAAFSAKAILSLGFLFGYYLIFKPSGKYYLLIFFLMYLIFSGLIAFDMKRVRKD